MKLDLNKVSSIKITPDKDHGGFMMAAIEKDGEVLYEPVWDSGEPIPADRLEITYNPEKPMRKKKKVIEEQYPGQLDQAIGEMAMAINRVYVLDTEKAAKELEESFDELRKALGYPVYGEEEG